MKKAMGRQWELETVGRREERKMKREGERSAFMATLLHYLLGD